MITTSLKRGSGACAKALSHRLIGPRYLISAVARVYEPGAKVDHVLILEGPQGRLKSEALRTLAISEAWFTDRLSHLASKDSALDIAGVLIVEIAEMDALTRATPSAMKAFITRRRDRFRPPYGKHVIDRPRQNIFAGSINPPAGGYLKDPTGARRLWPVACHWHDRPRRLGRGARPVMGRGRASIQGGCALVADTRTRSARDRRAGGALCGRCLGGRRPRMVGRPH